MLPRPAVKLRVEMLRRELGQEVAQLGVRRDPGECIPLEPGALLQQPRRDLTRRASGFARGEPGLGFLRQVEPVGGEADRVLPFRSFCACSAPR